MIRLPPALYAAIEQRGRRHLRSANNEMVVLLKLGLANEAEEATALAVADRLIAEDGRRKSRQARSSR